MGDLEDKIVLERGRIEDGRGGWSWVGGLLVLGGWVGGFNKRPNSEKFHSKLFFSYN